MEKRRYKLKKVKKQWARVALTTTVAGLVGASSPALAETTDTAVSTGYIASETSQVPTESLGTPQPPLVEPAQEISAPLPEVSSQSETQPAITVTESPETISPEAVPAETSTETSTALAPPADTVAPATSSSDSPSQAESQEPATTPEKAETVADTPRKSGFDRDAENKKYYYDPQTGEKVFDQFITVDGNSYYMGTDGQPTTGYLTLDKKLYYFNSAGIQAKGLYRHPGSIIRYYDPVTGQAATNSFFTDQDGKTYYFDETATAVKGNITLDNSLYFFDRKGVQVKGFYRHPNSTFRYYDLETGKAAVNTFITDTEGNRYYFDDKAVAVKGELTLGEDLYYFDNKGIQVKGLYRHPGSIIRYYNTETGKAAKSAFIKDEEGNHYYFDEQFNAVKGYQTIDGDLYYFDRKGVQIRGAYTHSSGKTRYYAPETGKAISNATITDGDKTYMLDKHGVALTGYQVIDGDLYFFDSKGVQARGLVNHGSGRIRYYAPETGKAVNDRFVTDQGNRYYFDKLGRALRGNQVIEGQHYHFAEDGKMTRGQWADALDSNRFYYDAETGIRVSNRFITDDQNRTYYLGENGLPLTGDQIINGVHYSFSSEGVLIPQISQETEKDEDLASKEAPRKETDRKQEQAQVPEQKTEQVELPKQDTRAIEQGHRPLKIQISPVNRFEEAKNGLSQMRLALDEPSLEKIAANTRVASSINLLSSLTYNYSYTYSDSRLSFFNQFVTLDGYTYYYGPQGLPLTGSQTIDGKKYFFDQEGRQIKGEVAEDEEGILRYYDEETGELVYSRTLTLTKGEDAGRTISIDKEGVVTYI